MGSCNSYSQCLVPGRVWFDHSAPKDNRVECERSGSLHASRCTLHNWTLSEPPRHCSVQSRRISKTARGLGANLHVPPLRPLSSHVFLTLSAPRPRFAETPSAQTRDEYWGSLLTQTGDENITRYFLRRRLSDEVGKLLIVAVSTVLILPQLQIEASGPARTQTPHEAYRAWPAPSSTLQYALEYYEHYKCYESPRTGEPQGKLLTGATEGKAASRQSAPRSDR
jgi:hypothetical protein